MGGRLETKFKFRASCSSSMINYLLSQKFKLIGNHEFNHLNIILTNFDIILVINLNISFYCALNCGNYYKIVSSVFVTIKECTLWGLSSQILLVSVCL